MLHWLASPPRRCSRLKRTLLHHNSSWAGGREPGWMCVCVRACVLLCVCVIFMCAFAKKTCHLLVTDTYMSQCCCVCVCEITCLCPYPYIDLPCFMCLFSAYFILQHSHRILPANKTSDGKLYRSFIWAHAEQHFKKFEQFSIRRGWVDGTYGWNIHSSSVCASWYSYL